jgi:SAM-dependent methyltransferase
LSINPAVYELEPHIAELYDKSQNYSDDVELIRTLLGGRPSLRVLEPFCGTGRILIPLARDGHSVVGMDCAKAMLDGARAKVKELLKGASGSVDLVQVDVTSGAWPRGFDLVVLGGNCLYELATAEEQEACIRAASRSLETGGSLYLDTDTMEGDLHPSWTKPGVSGCFPTGVCGDGTRFTSTWETIGYDIHQRLVTLRRCTRVEKTDGTIVSFENIQQKHTAGKAEAAVWLERNGFAIEKLFGDRMGRPCTGESGRAIFWARKH